MSDHTGATSWHADAAELHRYASGTIDHAGASSVEAHLVACASCRRQVAPFVEPGRLEGAWAEIVELLDAPRPGPVERLLRRLGVSEPTARLLAATPSLRLSWFLGVVVALAFSLLAAGSDPDAAVVFLVVAPLLPLAGVSAAFGELDPAYEVTCAAPTSGVRLLLVRATTVFVATLAITGAAALALPAPGWAAAGWILPALGLTVASLGLSTLVPPERAAVVVAASWLAVVLASAEAAGNRLAAFQGPAQVMFLLLAGVAALVVVRRREAFEIRSQL